ncbi:MAG: hypothetical protein KIT19_08970 [Phycisphaeraceae bacterium]|nr:hypothetical protein [Phycisphaeraceae bacterium]
MTALIELIRILLVALFSIAVRAAAGSDGVIHTPGDMPDLAYTLAYEPGELPALSVGLSFKGSGDGVSTISLPEQWGGIDEPGNDIASIVASSDDGTPIKVSRDGPRTWTISHTPGARITCEYRIAPGKREPWRRGNDYRTVVSPELVHAIGNLALAYPDHMRTPEPREIALDLTGLAMPGWQVVSSHGPGPSRRVVRMPGEKFLHAAFIAGNGRMLEKQIGRNRLGVYIHSDLWSFSDETFADLCATIVRAERDFFADHSDPWFLISLVPQGNSAPGGYSLGGTGLTNAFALYCTPTMSLEPGSHQLRSVQRLLAHEYMHTWIGGKISVRDTPETLGYWFSEGFTDFLARRVLHKTGLWTDVEYAADLSDALGRYDASPARSAGNNAIAGGFWSDPIVRDLPYRRGDLLALAIDERIRAANASDEGTRTLEHLIRDLLTRAIENGEHATTDKILTLVEAYTDADFAARARASINDGGHIPIPERTTVPALELTTRQMRSSDPGFDMEATRTSKIITGIVPGSGAAEAGLMDGMKLVSFTMNNGSGAPPKAVATIKSESGDEITFEYEAVSAPRAARAYVPVPHRPD